LVYQTELKSPTTHPIIGHVMPKSDKVEHVIHKARIMSSFRPFSGKR
jgi:hypothetical protein